MNGNYMFNQMIARQRIQERLREAEMHRLAAQAKPAAGEEQTPKPSRGWFGRWLEALHLAFSPRKTEVHH